MRRGRRAARKFETLEARDLFAGDVTVTMLSGGRVQVVGDDRANSIELRQISATDWKIIGNDTRVNGGSRPVTVRNVTGEIWVGLAEGNDSFKMSNASTISQVTIIMFDGNDKVNLSNIRAAAHLTVNTGYGNDVVHVDNVRMPGRNASMSLSDGTGRDRFIVDQLFAYSCSIDAGTGGSLIAVSNSALRSHLSVRGHKGTQIVSLTNVAAPRFDVVAGTRDDADCVLIIDSCRAERAEFTGPVDATLIRSNNDFLVDRYHGFSPTVPGSIGDRTVFTVNAWIDEAV
jgi:hypothetical protein